MVLTNFATTSTRMQRGKKATSNAKTRNLHRAELLVLEAQRDFVEQRIRVLEKQPQTGRNLKRDSAGPPISDRLDAHKRPKHDGDVHGTMNIEDMFNQCRKMLTQLKKNSNSAPFLAPVDPVALNCPDYFKIVKKPMDFKTITAKLRPMKRIYTTPLEFRDDMRQVFKNCALYNPVGNQIRIMGDRLSQSFESLWTKSNIERSYYRREEELKRVSPSRSSVASNDTDCVVQERRDGGLHGSLSKKTRSIGSEADLKKITNIYKRIETLIIAADEEKKEEITANDAKSMDFWQKRKLSAELEKASIATLPEIAKIVSETEESGQKEILLDSLQQSVSWRLWTTVKSTKPVDPCLERLAPSEHVNTPEQQRIQQNDEIEQKHDNPRMETDDADANLTSIETAKNPQSVVDGNQTNIDKRQTTERRADRTEKIADGVEQNGVKDVSTETAKQVETQVSAAPTQDSETPTEVTQDITLTKEVVDGMTTEEQNKTLKETSSEQYQLKLEPATVNATPKDPSRMEIDKKAVQTEEKEVIRDKPSGANVAAIEEKTHVSATSDELSLIGGMTFSEKGDVDEVEKERLVPPTSQ